MKFVRIFALLIALAGVLAAGQNILGLFVTDGYGDVDAGLLYALEGIVAGLFGYGAYVLTTNEDS